MGLILPFVFLHEAVDNQSPVALLYSALSFYAWYCYFVMALAWIKNKSVEKWYPILGTISALTILVTNATFGIANATEPVKEFGMAFVQTSFFAWPAIMMACWLVFFHLKLSRNHTSNTSQ